MVALQKSNPPQCGGGVVFFTLNNTTLRLYWVTLGCGNSTFEKAKNWFSREAANFQEGVVGGKMNSYNVGHKIKVSSLGLVNNIFRGF